MKNSFSSTAAFAFRLFVVCDCIVVAYACAMLVNSALKLVLSVADSNKISEHNIILKLCTFYYNAHYLAPS